MGLHIHGTGLNLIWAWFCALSLRSPPRGVPGLQWLIGSRFFSDPLAIASAFRSIHALSPNDLFSVDYDKESEDLRVLLIRGFHVIGALAFQKDGSTDQVARKVANAALELKKFLVPDGAGSDNAQNGWVIGAVGDSDTGDIQFFASGDGGRSHLQTVPSVVYDNDPDKYIWEKGCLMHCQLPIKLPFFYPMNNSADASEMYSSSIGATASKLKQSDVSFVLESSKKRAEILEPVFLRGYDLFSADPSFVGWSDTTSRESDQKSRLCSHFCSHSSLVTGNYSAENADIIEVTALLNRSIMLTGPAAPGAVFFPALEEAKLLIPEFNLDILCYASKDLPLIDAIRELVIPALIDQLGSYKIGNVSNLLTEHPQLRPYHFNPPGLLHPVTVIYELSYGENEMKQVEVRKLFHARLGLRTDRPLLRISNALSFIVDGTGSRGRQKGPSLLKDVHIGIPSSGVTGGVVSLVEGSYEYYHYLQDGFDDSGWGCAYRSLQTIISWFKLQLYTSIDVPSHREIQKSLVEIGDKEPSFVGSREWIGAIELSFVLDKLLGVSCKVINVRSGSELPEKCQELALHFEVQGTPIMIGGGVLAYTLLGVDYNKATGDCAFLILDPHYTGSDDHKKIINGGWCGWKKAVDNKGKSFFLHDKFYNLLLPQRPDMV
ncbi:hypothetical protein MLD38_039400 [Melastoma candidum]|uniref:Uncharacterized protein n=1 Tax=Melastoma candidum TaxID=119954 RepID=A0ACB9L292_9MYRT|nr:hypothetical protein MLD38_039400 [Melastoma candidum]